MQPELEPEQIFFVIDLKPSSFVLKKDSLSGNNINKSSSTKCYRILWTIVLNNFKY